MLLDNNCDTLWLRCCYEALSVTRTQCAHTTSARHANPHLCVPTPRNDEAAVVMETAALLATSRKHKEPNLDLGMLWRNLEAAQLGKRGAPTRGELSYIKDIRSTC